MMCVEISNKRLLNVKELSKYLGMSPYTVRDRVRKGKFPFHAKRLGRLLLFDIDEVNNYIDSLPINQPKIPVE